MPGRESIRVMSRSKPTVGAGRDPLAPWDAWGARGTCGSGGTWDVRGAGKTWLEGAEEDMVAIVPG
ncbi:hypothetical protein GCM10009654_44550 [Streptomyces hebeiensis]|uniref:Uncharacterized protein n=1 Tax=Streptomyces hebeiensis TaxID=229486 RepID=A0ABN1UYS2_9ACTN